MPHAFQLSDYPVFLGDLRDTFPAWLRDRLPVLWVDGEPAWVGGIGVAAEFACAPGAAGLVPEWRPGGVTPAPPP